MKKKQVLFLEDPLVTENTTTSMLREKFNLFVAFDRKEAWHLIRDWNFDCVVTAIDNPVMKGIDLLKEIRKAGYDTSVILMTERNSTQLKCHCEELGATDYIVKPITADNLINRIDAVMQLKTVPDNQAPSLLTA